MRRSKREIAWLAAGLLAVASGTVRADEPASSTSVEGNWAGTLGQGPKPLRLVLAIYRGPDGARHARLDSVDQHAKLPIDIITVTGQKLHFEIAAIGGVYDASVELGGKKLGGSWVQRGVPAQPLSFERVVETGHSAAGTKAGPAGPFGPPIEVVVPRAPVAALAHAQRHLFYELHVTNFSANEVSLVSVEVLDGAGVKIARSDGADLAMRVVRVAHNDDTGDAQLRIAPGTRSVIYMWIPRASSAPLPLRISHRIEVREADGVVRAQASAPIDVTENVLRIGPPLRGRDWQASNGPGDVSNHRRALIPIGGHAYIAQRFAIDWVRIGPDGSTFHGDPKKNTSYLAYGTDALAVADGVVAAIKDGISENVPGERAQAVTLENVAGNHVLLDLGSGRRTLYAHLQPGSLRVKVGDRVRRGQVLGLVGNTGNSTEPHLHFHVAEGESPLAAEGIPYALEKFESRRSGTAKEREKRTNELPLQNEVVDFTP